MIPTTPDTTAPLHSTCATHPTRTGDPVVYFITNDHAVPPGMSPQVIKIGTTVDLPGRTLRLQRLYPHLLARLIAWRPGGEDVERQIHYRYGHLRVIGGKDWFWVSGLLLDDLLEAGTI